MFEDFKTVDIVLNKADENILTQESFILNSGDYNGRKLRVQITNDGIVEDTSGISLNFGFWRYDLDEKGVFPFEVVDYTKGLYEINYPSEMLQEKEGMAVCQIQMIDIQGSIVNSYDFKVNIKRSLFTEEFVVAENSPTVLQKALIDISRNTTEILIIEATLAEILSQYNNLYNYFEENVATKSQWQEVKENVDQINLNTSLVADNNEMLKRTLLDYSVQWFSGDGYDESFPNEKKILELTAEEGKKIKILVLGISQTATRTFEYRVTVDGETHVFGKDINGITNAYGYAIKAIHKSKMEELIGSSASDVSLKLNVLPENIEGRNIEINLIWTRVTTSGRCIPYVYYGVKDVGN